MGMSLAQRFGSSASLNAGVLSVTITELTGLSSATATPDQIFAAMILHSKATQPVNAVDDATIGVTIDEPFKSFSRNDTQISHQYAVSLYETAGSVGTIDPDDVVS